MTRDQHRRVDEISELLPLLDGKDMIQLKQQKQPAFQRIKNPRNFTFNEHRRVISLRFGSLEQFALHFQRGIPDNGRETKHTIHYRQALVGA